MRWPWVSRDFNDFCIAQLNEQRQENVRLYGTIHKLFDHIQALKLQGASEPSPPRVIEQPAPDPVMSAIAVASRGDRRLHTLMAQEAQRMRDRGDHEFDIIAAIQQGIESPEGLPA